MGRAFKPAVPPIFVIDALKKGSVKPFALTRHTCTPTVCFRCLLRREITLEKCHRLSSTARSLYGILLSSVHFITAFRLFSKDYKAGCFILSTLFWNFLQICAYYREYNMFQLIICANIFIKIIYITTWSLSMIKAAYMLHYGAKLIFFAKPLDKSAK